MIDLRHGVNWKLVCFWAVAIGASGAFEVWLAILLWRLFNS